MPAWSILLLPLSLVVVASFLFAAAWLEDWMLSPQRMIMWAAGGRRRVSAEHAEAFVAAQYERLLREAQGPDR